jgi:hypothetical protein
MSGAMSMQRRAQKVTAWVDDRTSEWTAKAELIPMSGLYIFYMETGPVGAMVVTSSVFGITSRLDVALLSRPSTYVVHSRCLQICSICKLKFRFGRAELNRCLSHTSGV